MTDHVARRVEEGGADDELVGLLGRVESLGAVSLLVELKQRGLFAAAADAALHALAQSPRPAVAEAASAEFAPRPSPEPSPPERKWTPPSEAAFEPHFRIVAKAIMDGRVVPFVGAGANLVGRPPSEDGPPAGRSCRRAESWQGISQTSSGTRAPMTSTCFACRSTSRHSRKRGPLYQELHDIFAAASHEPSAVHRMLAALPRTLREHAVGTLQLIVTTNYDDALERAFDHECEPYDLISYETQEHLFVHHTPNGDVVPIKQPNKYSGIDLASARPF